MKNWTCLYTTPLHKDTCKVNWHRDGEVGVTFTSGGGAVLPESEVIPLYKNEEKTLKRASENLSGWSCEVREKPGTIVRVRYHKDNGTCGCVYESPFNIQGDTDIFSEEDLIPKRKNEEPKGSKSYEEYSSEELREELEKLRISGPKKKQKRKKKKVPKEKGTRAKLKEKLKSMSSEDFNKLVKKLGEKGEN